MTIKKREKAAAAAALMSGEATETAANLARAMVSALVQKKCVCTSVFMNERRAVEGSRRGGGGEVNLIAITPPSIHGGTC